MSVTITLRLWRNPCLHPSLPLNRSTPLASSNAPTQASPPNSHFSVPYLIQSCGLSSDEALRVSQRFPGLIKSSSKPDAVLCFLRETGVSEFDIKNAVSRDPRILHSHVEKNWRPNIAKLQELGFSIEYISGIIVYYPSIFRANFVSKIDFWMGVLGSVENLSVVLTKRATLLNSSLGKVIMPNLSFLKEQCGLSFCQIAQLIKCQPKIINSSIEALKMKAKRAEELGIGCSSPMLVYALIVVCNLNQQTIDARLNNLKNLGFSKDEVTTLVCSKPLLLKLKEETMCSKIQFLIKDTGCDKLQLVRNPVLLTLSLEKRLIPRSLVLKLVESKGLAVPRRGLFSIAKLTENQFLEKMVLPYEHTIPGLHQAYTDVVSGKTSAKSMVL